MIPIKELPPIFDATRRTMFYVLEQIKLNCVICFREHVSCRTDFGFVGTVNGEYMFISDRLFLSTFIKINVSGTTLKPISIRDLLNLMTPEDAYTFFEGKTLKATGLQQIEVPEFNRVTGERIGTRIVTRAVLEII